VEFTLGKMEDAMRVNTLMIANMGMVSTFGRMAASMRAHGRMESNTAKVFTSRQTARSAEVFGKMERESSGLMSNESGDRDIAWLNFILLTSLLQINLFLLFQYLTVHSNNPFFTSLQTCFMIILVC